MGFVFEDDALIEPDSIGEPHSQHKLDSSLLDVSQLLESVCIYLLVLAHCLK
jgi:hypothetical protein